jgi:hypothetical protein
MPFASERRSINLPARQAPLPFSDAVLVQAGMTMDDLVWVQVFSPDVAL